MGQQKKNTEKNWHGNETPSSQLKTTDFEAQPEAARQLVSNESLFHDPEFVDDTPVTVMNNQSPKRLTN